MVARRSVDSDGVTRNLLADLYKEAGGEPGLSTPADMEDITDLTTVLAEVSAAVEQPVTPATKAMNAVPPRIDP